MDNPLISIIIPVYNMEKYLNEALDSVINQTYKNLEIIIIDDGSKDNSLQICDEYAKKDERIVLIHKKNEGVSAARNDALKICKGEYIFFMDSDDFIDVDAINTLYTSLKDNKADLVCGNTYDFDDKKPYNYILTRKKEHQLIEGCDNVLISFYSALYFTCVIWNKLYKKSIIEGIEFDRNISYAEDLVFLSKVLKNVERLFVNNDVVTYYYRKREISLAHDTSYNDRCELEVGYMNTIIEDLKKTHPVAVDSAILYMQRCAFKCIREYIRKNKEKNGVKHLFENINKYSIKFVGKEKKKYFIISYMFPLWKMYYLR